ncbi:putative pentachlorophenol 4-monooxygenase [Mytilinidion resinicola]|uniref:Pentachlorophenol 4-monooxygenase n=1 Tax=Mytilinidion resinicola TaxID=574789 RepID=A0A6A6Y585_9PEZI|nr:putative pentachlorophenol 4-monooxygenase [Mytilinidion resinicola]KAF2803184.1 putative pentachlorophenol 4-monooxygenase [Mytilinidion resinicola]
MSKLYDVVIAGAGPIGLFLACELGLAHVSVLVLERNDTLESSWKTAPLGRRSLNTLSVESFYRRGLLDKLVGSGQRPSVLQKTAGIQFAGQFAGIMLNANKLDLTRWKYRLPGPALVPEQTTMGASRRGNGVTRIVAQDNEVVTVETGENQTFRSKWLVGCDGGRSVIRKAAGFDFVGTEAKFTAYAVKGDFDHPEKLKPGFHATKNGMYVFMKPDTVHLVDFDSAAFDRTKEITQEHLQDVLNRVVGTTDVIITAVHLASSYTDRSKQTTHYRNGRVLVAGDAAHIHSPLGAQGLNVGLGDAMNLGWKLAATVHREAEADGAATDLALLDTYESERHPIAAWVLEWTRAQVSTLQPGPYGAAVHTLIRDLIATTDGTNLFIDRVWGLSQRYALGDGEAHAHPFVGCSAPDFELLDGARLGPKLDGGRGLLVEFEGAAALKKLVVGGKFEGRVDYVCVGAKDRRDLRALLIRPDGIVAWVAEDNKKYDVNAAKAALEQWFGF